MCTKICMAFGKNNLNQKDIENKNVIEIGSYNVNGSIRGYVESLKPQKYIGTDMREGPCVDVCCNASDLIDKFGKETFDVVISMETLEHIELWQLAISNFKNICKTNGIILLTTVSKGYGKHDYPSDYWRYEISDLEHIFSDCVIEKTEGNDRNHTVFIKVRKPDDFVEVDLSSYELYKII